MYFKVIMYFITFPGLVCLCAILDKLGLTVKCFDSLFILKGVDLSIMVSTALFLCVIFIKVVMDYSVEY